MSDNTMTVPGELQSLDVRLAAPDDVHFTSYSSVEDFDKIKDLLSETPLRAPYRPDSMD